MKHFLINATMLLTLGAMVSCSNDEPANGGGQTVAKGEQYMAVRLQSVGNPGGTSFGKPASRATEVGNPEFEEGVGNENAITAANVRFYFFTETGLPFVMSESGVNGEVSETNMVKPYQVSSANTNGEAVGLDAVLVLGTPTEPYKGDKPAKVVCVANATDFTQFANKRLEDLLRETVNTPATWNTFMMTSSTYVDESGTLTYFTNVEDKIKETAAAAEADPANIFIERLAVKIRATGLGDYQVMEKDPETGAYTGKIFLLRNEDPGVPLYVTLTGWQPYLTANRAYGIKNIDMKWTAEENQPFSAWNIPQLHRCYWANVPGLSFQDNSYNIYSADQFKYSNFDSNAPTQNVFYTYENTLGTATSLSEFTDNTTAMVVRGVVHREGETEGLDFCRWGGDYYHSDYLKQVIVTAYNAERAEDAQATIADVEFVIDPSNPNHYFARVKGNDFKRFNNILWWKDGVTSYFVNIEHLGGKFGVVRNHIYDYKFSNVIGLGIPGNEPEKPVEEETFLAARVYVLNWHVISTTLDLE